MFIGARHPSGLCPPLFETASNHWPGGAGTKSQAEAAAGPHQAGISFTTRPVRTRRTFHGSMSTRREEIRTSELPESKKAVPAPQLRTGTANVSRFGAIADH